MAINKTYNWEEIQKYYDVGNSIRSITKEFGCAQITIQRARDKGDFIPRDKNQLRKEMSHRREKKYCPHCNKLLKDITGRGQYCNNTCYSIHVKENYLKNWLQGKETGTTELGGIKTCCRKYVLEKADYSCSKCGCNACNPYSGLPIVQVDHIDGDSTNNYLENLRVLCPSCHAMTENFGSRNKGKGRARRRLDYAKFKSKIQNIVREGDY